MQLIKSSLLISVLPALVLLCSACKNSDDKGSITFSIEGSLLNADNKTLYIEEMTPDNGAQFVDSIFCDKNGHFKYSGSMNYQTFFILHNTEYDYIVLLPDNGETIKISGNCDKLDESYYVDNSQGSLLLWQIQNYINDANIAISNIAQLDKKNRATLSDTQYEQAHKVTDSLFIAEHSTAYLMFYNFIQDNAGSLATLYAVDAPFNHTGRIFYAQPDFEVFELVLDGLENSMPTNPHTQFFKTRVEKIRSARILEQQQQQADQRIIVE